MPGFDGTGPRGFGPMTGAGRGFCVLKAPAALDDTVTGIAGLTSRPVRLRAGNRAADLASLRIHAQRIEMILKRLRRRMAL